jgi:hypothetical protein
LAIHLNRLANNREGQADEKGNFDRERGRFSRDGDTGVDAGRCDVAVSATCYEEGSELQAGQSLREKGREAEQEEGRNQEEENVNTRRKERVVLEGN